VPTTRLAPNRLPWQTQARLRSRPPGSRQQTLKPFPPTVVPLWRSRKPLVAEQHSLAILPLFPCCLLVWRSLETVSSVPALWQDDLHTPRCRRQAPVHSSLQACPQTTGLPGLNGIEAARRIRKLSPESKILVLTQESSADVVQEVLSWGVLGYVVKAQAGSELLAAVQAVYQWRIVGSPFHRRYRRTSS
jgi:CheY-like chemotaxis protein